MRNLLQSMSGVQLRLLYDRNIFMILMKCGRRLEELQLLHHGLRELLGLPLALMSADNYSTTPTRRIYTLPSNKYVCIQLTHKQACYYIVN